MQKQKRFLCFYNSVQLLTYLATVLFTRAKDPKSQITTESYSQLLTHNPNDRCFCGVDIDHRKIAWDQVMFRFSAFMSIFDHITQCHGTLRHGKHVSINWRTILLLRSEKVATKTWRSILVHDSKLFKTILAAIFSLCRRYTATNTVPKAPFPIFWKQL